jgi:CBS domain-containing protein
MDIGQILSSGWAEITKFSSFASLLREHGVNLARIDPAELPLERGTPVYVEADADFVSVERRMVLAHVRFLFVLDEMRILGVIDLVDLIDRAGELAWDGWRGTNTENLSPLA